MPFWLWAILGDEGTIDICYAALHDRDENVREAAIEAIERLPVKDYKRAIEELSFLLQENNETLRSAASELIEKFRGSINT